MKNTVDRWFARQIQKHGWDAVIKKYGIGFSERCPDKQHFANFVKEKYDLEIPVE